MTDADTSGGAPQHLVLRAARRRWQVVVAGMIVGLLAGLIAAIALPHKYVAAAKVVVNPVPSDRPDQGHTSATPPVTMGTEAQIARSSVVAALAATKFLPTSVDPHVLSSGLVVSVVPDSSVLRFAFTARKASDALAGAQAYAAAYLDNRATTARRFVSSVITQLRQQISDLHDQIARVKAARDAAPRGSAERERQTVALNTLNQNLLTAETGLAAQQNAQIEPGTEITAPTSAGRAGANAAVVVLLGLIVGGGLGLLAATLWERTDPRLREAGDIQDDLGVPLLAVLPPHDAHTIIDPDSAAADAYRSLRNEIFLGPRPPVVLAVSRVDPATGTGDVTANLAVVLARSGRRVCVIDTDTGPHRLETMLDGVDRVGLVHAAGGDNPFEPGIAVLTQKEGVGSAKLGDVLASPLFARLVDATRTEADVVLIDAPPVLTAAGQAVLSTADAALLVVTARRTRRDDVLAADDRIRRVGSRLIGTAVREGARVPVLAPAPRELEQAALSAAERPALPSYQPVPPTNNPVYQPADVHASTSAPGPVVPPGVPEQPLSTAPVPAGVGLAERATALGWPPGPVDHSVSARPVDANSDLGWPESRRAITP
ncbi:MAG: hypothetical protein ACJ735_04200 [Actinomycetes bacterium]